MKTFALGTIFPTKSELAAMDASSDRLNAKMAAKGESIALSNPDLKGCVRKLVGGEVRYYDTVDQYAIVSRQGKVIWFQVRDDGDYRL